MPALNIPAKPAIAIGCFTLLAAALPYLPGQVHVGGFHIRQIESAFSLPIPHQIPQAEAPKPVVVPPADKPEPHRKVTQRNLHVPPGSLDSFFAALRRTENKEQGAVTRILHYGDSPTTADSITADVRRLFQKRFGDAGHGFLLIAKPWAWYGHDGVTLDSRNWKIEPASQSRAADGFHGLGGVSFLGEAGAVSQVRLPDARHTGAVVYYLAQPDGGTFAVTAGESMVAQVNTAGEQKKPAFAQFALPAGTQSLELRVTSGKVRLFGYRFDKDPPGVQYSSLGVNGAQVQMMARYFEVGQWAAAMQHENPDLVVLNYGTNESIYPAYIEKQYPEELRTVITRIREALPHASVLLMSPMDRGVMEGGEIVTPPALGKLIEVQKRIAAETGCAFFNTFEAMGGAGTMGRWYQEQPRLVSADFMHPLPQGAAKVGSLFEQALVAAYEGSGK
jgi:lysophospholipase L1-like esterase